MARGNGGYRAALRHRDFRLLMIRFVISGIGSWAYNVALIVFVYEQTQSAAWVGAITIGRFVPTLLISPYAGVVAERFERRSVILFSDLAALTLMCGLAAIALLDAPAGLAIVLAAMTSIVCIIDGPATAALTPQIVGEDDLAAANALRNGIDNLVVIVGPSLGAGMLLFADEATTFVLNALTFAVAAMLNSLLTVRSEPTDVTEGGEAGVFQQMTVGLKAIKSSSTAAVLVAFSVLASFVYGTDTVLFAVIGESIGMGPDAFGYLLTGCGVGGVLAAGLINRLSSMPRLGAIITIGMAVYCVPTAAIAFIDDPQIIFMLQVARGAGTLVVDVLAITALQRMLAPDLVARVFGAFDALVLGAIALGAFVTPPLLRATGLNSTLLIVGLGVPAAVLAVWPWLARMDRTALARLAELAPRIRLLEALNIFSAASRATLERLAASATELDANSDTVVIREGDV
ncbi:MAG: MFS transporter, partial [Aldersonia sp.]|nr:MFS transporter [Aldersonia sp.]